jgi:hypothetical protein
LIKGSGTHWRFSFAVSRLRMLRWLRLCPTTAALYRLCSFNQRFSAANCHSFEPRKGVS